MAPAMNLNSMVKQIEKDGEQLQGYRHKLAHEHLAKGMELIRLAHEENFQQLDRLAQAGEALIAAIQNARNLPEPYVAMAYLFVLVENFASARLYLQAVLESHPGYADALGLMVEIEQREKAALRQKVQQGAASPRPTLTASLPQSPAEIDYDDLYDQLEELILAEVKKISEYPQISPTPSRKVLKEIHQYHQIVAGALEKIQTQLRIVEEEIETHELQTRIRPLEVLHKRYQTSLQFSRQLIKLLERIQQEQLLVHEQLGNLAGIESAEDFGIMEENLDALLDGSDQIANEIEALEQQGVISNDAENEYEQLVKGIEKFQDALDDYSEFKQAG